MTTIEMRVHMDCAGCVSKIRKSLQKLKGVDDVEIDMGMQKVTVTGWADKKKVLKTIRRSTGRRAELRQFLNHPDHHYDNNFTDHYYHQHHHGGSTTTHYAPPPPPPSSSYNYYKHGYEYDYGHNRSNNNHVSSHPTMFGHQTGSAFSDENPHGCSVM
ncbi:hypothetical protein RHMOL_Rhmol06G0185200 [Rhododendron molle]|uniref:Uncharacterized protein n=1 Tax=Rhododendron molle TaxID=49168 RepID=A0ACC0NEU8_RHOML|nr:hypothetical protein RHMOL_Rhmol06G0185200 [Rhododendron molle]